MCVYCAFYATTCGDGDKIFSARWGRGQIKIGLVRTGIKLLPQGRGRERFSPMSLSIVYTIKCHCHKKSFESSKSVVL
jgi:hypothetical protein